MTNGLYAFLQAIHDGKDTKCDTMETPHRRIIAPSPFRGGGWAEEKILAAVCFDGSAWRKTEGRRKWRGLGCLVINVGVFAGNCVFCGKRRGCSGKTAGFLRGKNGAFQGRESFFCGVERGGERGLEMLKVKLWGNFSAFGRFREFRAENRPR